MYQTGIVQGLHLGSGTIESNDMWGDRTILSHVGMGQFFAETYAYLKDTPMLVDVTANEDCRVALLSLEKGQGMGRLGQKHGG